MSFLRRYGWMVLGLVVPFLIGGAIFFYLDRQSQTRLRLASVLPIPAIQNPFLNKSKVAEGIYADSTQNFSTTNAAYKTLPPNESYRTAPVGTIVFSPSLKVRIDAVYNLVHFPSFYRLYNSGTGALLLELPVYQIEDTLIYFSGNGSMYVNGIHLRLCGPRHTQKFVARNGLIQLEKLALDYVGADTEVAYEASLQLFDSESGSRVIATVPPPTTVTLIGLSTSKSSDQLPPMLVKTPLGLTGWHRPEFNEQQSGRLTVYLCN